MARLTVVRTPRAEAVAAPNGRISSHRTNGASIMLSITAKTTSQVLDSILA
nr:hypothetical protein [Halomonas huangheensis]